VYAISWKVSGFDDAELMKESDDPESLRNSGSYLGGNR